MPIIHADDTNFDAKIKAAKGLVVVDFYADWCGPCQDFGPVFEEVSNETKGVTFIKVNTDNAPITSEKLGILGIPRIIFFKKGEVIREASAMSKEGLKAKIKELNQ